MKFQTNGEVIANNKIGDQTFHLKLNVPIIPQQAKPGQFLHIHCNDSYVPFLRRPMSIFNVDKNAIEMIYRVKGAGTEILSHLKAGNTLDILGPLGNNFSINKDYHSLIVGGGMGVVPLYYLTKKIIEKKQAFNFFMGMRNENELKNFIFFRKLVKKIQVATDDGSAGHKGFITELLEEQIKRLKDRKIKIYACGPHSMLIAVQKIALQYNIECEISLEEYMGCGVGACLSCVCKTKENQYKRVCIEGPVFRASEVILN